MSILSVSFLLFCAALLILYYLLPKKAQWLVLLAFSLGFYGLAGWRALPFLLVTALSCWGTALFLQRSADRQKAYLKEHKLDLSREQKDAYKTSQKRRRRLMLALALLCNIGILCAFKYVHFLLAQVNRMLALFGGGFTDAIDWLIPLGISFYTFQCVGYVLDVYWGRCTAERNPAKVLLFTSFFPQITQGPISSWQALSGELFAEHRFDAHNYSYGLQRMLWGYFKKTVVANVFSGYVSAVFAGYEGYTGAAVLLGALCYSAQIYADFSGYMDIMCGLCQILGIKLTENFERPYFSKSVAEYWRRWHISLGVWFKNYVYYPLAVAKWNQRLGRFTKKKLGRSFGNYLPATLALVVVWLATGLWHGASWAYIAWGGVNGLFIIFSMWMEKPFDRCKRALHINESAWLWRAFQVLRTFALVTFIKVLPEVGTLSQGLGLWKRIFTGPLPHSAGELLPFVDSWRVLGAALFGVGLMFVVSLLQRRGSVRERMERRLPFFVRILCFAFLFFMIVYFGVPASGGLEGFMYAQF